MNYNTMLKELKRNYDKLDLEIKDSLSFDTYVRFVLEANRR